MADNGNRRLKWNNRETNAAGHTKRPIDFRDLEEDIIAIAWRWLKEADGISIPEVARRLQKVFQRPQGLDDWQLRNKVLRMSKDGWCRKTQIEQMRQWPRDHPRVSTILEWIESGNCMWAHRSRDHSQSVFNQNFSQAVPSVIYEEQDDEGEEEEEQIKVGQVGKLEELRRGFGKGYFYCEKCANPGVLSPEQCAVLVYHQGAKRQCSLCNEIVSAVFCTKRRDINAPPNKQRWRSFYGNAPVKIDDMRGFEVLKLVIPPLPKTTTEQAIITKPTNPTYANEESDEESDRADGEEISDEQFEKAYQRSHWYKLAEARKRVAAGILTGEVKRTRPDAARRLLNRSVSPPVLAASMQSSRAACIMPMDQSNSISASTESATSDSTALVSSSRAFATSEPTATTSQVLVRIQDSDYELWSNFGEGSFYCTFCNDTGADWAELYVIHCGEMAVCSKCGISTYGQTLYACLLNDVKAKPWSSYGQVFRRENIDTVMIRDE